MAPKKATDDDLAFIIPSFRCDEMFEKNRKRQKRNGLCQYKQESQQRVIGWLSDCVELIGNCSQDPLALVASSPHKHKPSTFSACIEPTNSELSPRKIEISSLAAVGTTGMRDIDSVMQQQNQNQDDAHSKTISPSTCPIPIPIPLRRATVNAFSSTSSRSSVRWIRRLERYSFAKLRMKDTENWVTVSTEHFPTCVAGLTKGDDNNKTTSCNSTNAYSTDTIQRSGGVVGSSSSRTIDVNNLARTFLVSNTKASPLVVVVVVGTTAVTRIS
jgi:hypothetical protein